VQPATQYNAAMDTLRPGFSLYVVAAELWGQVYQKLLSDDRKGIVYIWEGLDPYTVAGRACKYLYEHDKRMTRLVLVAHGSPGTFKLGEHITAGNADKLVAWLSDLFDEDAIGIEVVSCEALADDVQIIGGRRYGQANKPGARGIRHAGYELGAALAAASGQTVTGALYRLSSEVRIALAGPCRRVRPDGTASVVQR
jgi:hypothetical protein